MLSKADNSAAWAVGGALVLFFIGGLLTTIVPPMVDKSWGRPAPGLKPYTEIEATYLVPAGSPLQKIEDVDKPGVRIAVTARSAYDLWLERNIRHATLVRSDSLASATEKFASDKLDALAGLRPGLLGDIAKFPGARMLDGQFTAVQQAVGTARSNAASAAFLRDFVEEAKKSGLVARLIEKHGVVGRLSVAPPG